eukprot:scaffold2957_cov236-Cylindrotheca_fusiformis.AAC.1
MSNSLRSGNLQLGMVMGGRIHCSIKTPMVPHHFLHDLRPGAMEDLELPFSCCRKLFSSYNSKTLTPVYSRRLFVEKSSCKVGSFERALKGARDGGPTRN